MVGLKLIHVRKRDPGCELATKQPDFQPHDLADFRDFQGPEYIVLPV